MPAVLPMAALTLLPTKMTGTQGSCVSFADPRWLRNDLAHCKVNVIGTSDVEPKRGQDFFSSVANTRPRLWRQGRGSDHTPIVRAPTGVLAAELGQLGRTAEAKEALEQAIAIAPEHVEADIRGRLPGVRPEDHAHVLEGLRKAGWRTEKTAISHRGGQSSRS